MSASTTRQIGGVLLKPDGTPFANSSLTIYRDKRQVTPTAGAAIVDEVLRTVTGPGGEVSMALVPGKYLGQIRLSDADRYFSFTVPDGAGPFLIQDLIDTSPVTGEQFVLLEDLVFAARAWAEKPEDEEVVENGYSALHWAMKSNEAKDAAEAAQSAAEDAADRAEYAATVIENPVSYAPQTLDPSEQAQARANIDALGPEETPDRAFRRGNILGAVSEDGGIPTGAIIERGSNANGEYVRFADGTQICWFESNSETTSSSQATSNTNYCFGPELIYPFAASFSIKPKLTPYYIGVAQNPICAEQRSGTTTNAVVVRLIGMTTLSSARIGYVAIGRWF